MAAVAPSLLLGEAFSAPLEEVQRATSWSSPIRVSGTPDRDRSVSSPLVTLAPEGDITVVWTRNERLLSRTRQANGNWGPVRSVGMGFPVGLDVDADGDVTVVWERFLRGDRSVLLTSRRPDGGRWSPPHRLSRVPVIGGAFLGPTGAVLDVNPRGDAFVAWAYGSPEHTNINYRVEVSYRRNGGTWNPRSRVGQLGMVPQGAVVGHDGVPTVLAAHAYRGRLSAFTRGAGGWRPVGAPTSRRVFEAELTLGEDGTSVLATWTAFGLRGSWLTADGWSPARRLTRTGASFHAADIDRSGTATIAWQSPRGRVLVTRWTQGQDPEAPRTLARRGAEGVDVTVAANGTATVAWAGRVPGTRFAYRARAARRPLAGPWSATTTVSRRRNIDEFGGRSLDSWPGGRAALAWVNEDSKAIWLANGG